jgi:DNA-binding NarL/FixJ family response regulator
VATRSLRLALAVRRGDLAGVLAHATPDASPTPGDIALDNDLRALALLNLGTVEASLALPDAERHLREATALAHEIGRPYLAAAALARLGFAARIHPFAVTRQRCREAIEFAERHGWGAEPIVAPALVTLASTLVWTGELDEAERWLLRTVRAVETDTGPDVRLLVHIVSGMLHSCRGRHRDALRELTSATRLQAHLPDPHAVANQVTDWTVATQLRAGLLDEAHATLAGLDEDRAEIRNARAAILLAEHDPGAALAALRDVLNGTAPAIGYVTVVEAQLLAGRAHRQLGDRRAATAAAERALTLAGADRLVLPFAMTGATELLESLPRRDTEYEALRTEILDVLRGSSVLSVKPPSDQPVSGYLEKLSPGELRVIRYLPTNLSRPEIATELSISLNTVSTHIRSIYAKLGVGDRSSAVRRAQELQIPAAGCTVVVKPSEYAPISAGLMVAEIAEEPGFPPGVVNVVPHAPGAASPIADEFFASEDVRCINLIGGVKTARMLAERAGRTLKRTVLELGGYNPMIILDDVDVDYAVRMATFGSFFHQGQICLNTRKIIIQRRSYDEFLTKFVERTRSLPSGDPLDPRTIIGPLVHQGAVNLMDERVREAVRLGATLHTGGTHEGLVFQPTILTDVPSGATAASEETFGPLVIVEPVDTAEEAVAVANRVQYGLTSTILAGDTYRAFELAPKVLHGIVNVNAPTVNDEIHAPMGGVRDSGWGRTGPDSLADFTDVIWINTTSQERQFPF